MPDLSEGGILDGKASWTVLLGTVQAGGPRQMARRGAPHFQQAASGGSGLFPNRWDARGTGGGAGRGMILQGGFC